MTTEQCCGQPFSWTEEMPYHPEYGFSRVLELVRVCDVCDFRPDEDETDTTAEQFDLMWTESIHDHVWEG